MPINDGDRSSLSRRTETWILVIVAATFLAQLSAGLARGPGYADEGYAFYASLAGNFLEGNGLCYSPGELCTSRMPVYTLIIAPFVYSNSAYPGLIVLQSLFGAAIAWMTYRIGASLFNERVATGAAALAGLNPYAVIHNTAFQDTIVVNTLILFVVLCLVRSTTQRTGLLFAAGVALALAVLTSARVALLIPFVGAWVVSTSASGVRLRRTVCFMLPLTLMLGGWIYRNYSIDGAVVLTSEAGRNLWIANNPTTMSLYPNRSSDDVAVAEGDRLDEAARASIAVADPIQQDRAYAALAWNYISGHRSQALANAFAKVAIAFSGWLSPSRGWITQIGFAALFLPATASALVMLWLRRRDAAAHVLVGLIVIAFSLTTAIFWAHTSHQSYLHPLLFTYACAAFDLARSRLKST